MTAISPRRVEPGFTAYSADVVSPLTAVHAALNSFVAGRGNLEKARGAIIDALYESLEYADPILAMLKIARDSGKLSRTGHAQLTREIGRLTTEDLSTDVVPVTARLRSNQMDERPELKQSIAEKGRHADFTAAVTPEAVSKPLEAGSVLLHRFELLKCVADKGMGRVFQARDRLKAATDDSDALVAIKLLQPASGDPLYSLQKEALLAQSLNHPNIVNIFDLYRDANQYFITMEWLDGESLATRLDATRGQPIQSGQARSVLEGLSAALTCAHSKGIVHGDIKPGNVHLTAKGEVKLLDFGMARRIDSAPAKDSNELRAVTRAYASCELLEGELPDVRDDVFSLCCLWYRLITGVRPFGARDALQAERDQPRLKAPPGLSRAQWQTLKSGLAFRRAQRPDDVAALARELRREPTQGGTGKYVAGVLLVAGIATWSYWPELNQWLDSRELQPGALVTTRPPTSERLEGLVDGAPEQVMPTAPVLASGPARTPLTDAPTPIETKAPVADIPANELTLNPGATEPEILPARLNVAPDQIPPSDAAKNVELSAIAAPPANVANVVPTKFGPLGFRKDQYVVTESDTAVIINIDYPRTLAVPVSLSVIVAAGSALADQDFILPSSQVIVAGPGQPAARIVFPLIADSAGEYTEEFLVRLTSNDPAVQIARPEAVVIVLDDD